MLQDVGLDKLILLASKTALAYVVFFLALFSIPIYNQLKDSDLALAFATQKNAVIGESAIIVEIANSEKSRKRGLSGKVYLEDNKGLLFIYDYIDFHGIWMKDMYFPIDIIWLNSSLEIVHIEEKVSPTTYPKTFMPQNKALYVLEMNSGFVSKNHIKLGDQMTIL